MNPNWMEEFKDKFVQATVYYNNSSVEEYYADEVVFRHDVWMIRLTVDNILYIPLYNILKINMVRNPDPLVRDKYQSTIFDQFY